MLRILPLFLLLIYLIILFIFDGSCNGDNPMSLNLVFRLNLPVRNKDLLIDNKSV